MKRLTAVASVLALLCASSAHAGDSGLKIVDTYRIGGAGGWDYASFDLGTKRLYVTHATSIAAIDTATGTVTPNLAEADGAHIALPLDGGKTLLVTQGKLDKASFIDALTGADLGDVATAAKPDGAIFDPATGMVFVLGNGGDEIDAIDPASRTLTGRIPLAGAPESGAADGKGLIYTHLEDKDALVVIDSKTMRVKATFPLDDCPEPSGLALISDQNLILSACKNGFARISKADTGTEVARLPIGLHADGALYDARTQLGYVPSGAGTLTVISFKSAPKVLDVITTKPGARTAALDPDTGRLYLPYADYGPPEAPGKKPGIVPGTFAVLVVGP
ncbi:hypothetical protein [Asticcacaulis sp. EMRT-3]|uniref:YncE family protein n=1 Tax=Asticcacaulis sp. EMRT-3 TaxID=3040349 RepID=UPI0024AFCDDA|nr:hypothetical protein [Asticcacaulis sp. EMRT-3]MDI7775772.1 hypothetical protein [Asticcacaulis sp. EMRT-3]